MESPRKKHKIEDPSIGIPMIRGGNNNNNDNNTIERFPTDILAHIISYLPLNDILFFQGSSRTLRTAIGLERRDTDLSPFTAHYTGRKGWGRRQYFLRFGNDDDDDNDDVHTARLSLECRGFERALALSYANDRDFLTANRLECPSSFTSALFGVRETEYPTDAGGGGDSNDNEPKRRTRFVVCTPIFRERIRRYVLEFRPKRGCLYALWYKVGGDVENEVEVRDITVRTYRRKKEGGEESGRRRASGPNHDGGQQHHHHHHHHHHDDDGRDWWCYYC